MPSTHGNHLINGNLKINSQYKSLNISYINIIAKQQHLRPSNQYLLCKGEKLKVLEKAYL